MAYENLLLEVRDGVAHLTLNRPDQANGINIGMARDLMDATLAIAGDDRVRAVLLAGAGARFCGGGDVKEFAAQGGDLPQHLRRVIAYLHPAVESLVRGDAPVVAAVQGSAAGAGMGLAAAADIVIAGESTKFVMAYTAIAVTPDGASSWFLPRLIGVRRALELTLTNRPLSAAEALEWGLVTNVVPDEDVASEATAVAERLAQGPTRAFAGAKRLIHESLESSFEEHLAYEAEWMTRSARTADAAEGIAAFAEKRAPDFRGN
jgi:2-(1,2-epoxy-1,2-dihydrophenyl)acetyl-CoA isomerase